jgi:hypothetical protein
MPALATATEEAPVRPATWLTRVRAGFTPPPLPPTSRLAFRFHMAFILLDAVFAGIMGNAPLMAVKAMGATDEQLQVPLAMASIGLFAAVFSGAAMATRRKKPFVLVPGYGRARRSPPALRPSLMEERGDGNNRRPWLSCFSSASRRLGGEMEFRRLRQCLP